MVQNDHIDLVGVHIQALLFRPVAHGLGGCFVRSWKVFEFVANELYALWVDV
ncbi:hypothetical protein D9M71_118690 [compost metagenome]